ncbi:unnamed protein product [Brachionus calyciflorus]|uniref:Uncharacterized protein n=2 Tax=Brachionus calyciflorus TaxID=104777 RepID=A0A814C0N8_9BILA|nr:unnamed protein product [Brachionus calyciflorus]
MITNEVNTNSNIVDQKPKELENFLIDQSNQQNQSQHSINIIDSKLLTTTQLNNNNQPQVQQLITSNSNNSNNLPFIIQNGNIYQLATTTGGTNQINQSNLIQISTDNLKTNPIKLTTLKNTNVLNLNTINKSRIIVKTNPGELSQQGQQIITTISPNSLQNNQKLNQQNQLKSINLVLQNPNQSKQLFISNQQTKPQITTSQNGQPIIVLTQANRNDQNLQILLQQKNLQTNNLPSQTSIQQVKTNQPKIYVPQTAQNLNLPIKKLNENENKNSSPNLINLLNSNNQVEIKQEPVVNHTKIVYNKQQKEIVNITPIAANTKEIIHTNIEPQKKEEEINETILNECILPDTRIFASLLNKDHTLPNNNPNSQAQKNEIKYKTVLIGNTEHVILDNLQNLSDFKGNFSELKNLACSVADHLNKSVSIPAFLLIDSKSSVEKIKSLLGDININPIIIDTLTQGAQQNEPTPKQVDPNADREKFQQHHQNLIKKLSSNNINNNNPNNNNNSNQIEIINNQQQVNSNQDLSKQKKISTPKRRTPKPKKTQIVINSNGQALVNKSKLTINDLIQQNALNQSLEMEKSSEPNAKKIKTINQLVNIEQQKLVQPVVSIQTLQPIQQIQQCQPLPSITQIQQEPRLQNNNNNTNPSNDWLDQQIQIANEFIDTLTKNDEKMIKTESLDLVKQEPNLHMQNVVDLNNHQHHQQQPQQQQQQQQQHQNIMNDYNFELDPFDTNLYFSSNLNDIDF